MPVPVIIRIQVLAGTVVRFEWLRRASSAQSRAELTRGSRSAPAVASTLCNDAGIPETRKDHLRRMRPGGARQDAVAAEPPGLPGVSAGPCQRRLSRARAVAAIRQRPGRPYLEPGAP